MVVDVALILALVSGGTVSTSSIPPLAGAVAALDPPLLSIIDAVA